VEDTEFKEGKFTTAFLDRFADEFALLSTIAPTKGEDTTSFMSRLIQKGLMTIKGDML